MAGTKKMENAVAGAQTKEASFSNMELQISKPRLAKDGSLEVIGNFTELSQKITSVVEKYKGTVLTEDNVGYVKALKTQFQKLRTGIDSKRKDWKKFYITTPSKLLDAMCDDLQKIIAEGETSLGKQLEAFDQRRKDELTEVLKGYVEEAVASHGLREEYATQIVLKDKYYNLTQKEEDSADDIEAQAVELEKKQREYDAGLELINLELEGTMLVADTYIRQLEYKSANEIVLQIKKDKIESARLYEEAKKKEAEGKSVEIGEPIDEKLKKLIQAEAVPPKSNKFGDVRERTLWIRYKKEVAQDILDFFTEHGVEFKFLK